VTRLRDRLYQGDQSRQSLWDQLSDEFERRNKIRTELLTLHDKYYEEITSTRQKLREALKELQWEKDRAAAEIAQLREQYHEQLTLQWNARDVWEREGKKLIETLKREKEEERRRLQAEVACLEAKCGELRDAADIYLTNQEVVSSELYKMEEELSSLRQHNESRARDYAIERETWEKEREKLREEIAQQ